MKVDHLGGREKHAYFPKQQFLEIETKTPEKGFRLNLWEK